MILLNIDRTSSTPIYQQIIGGIIQLVESETISVGTQLPSTRMLANKLGLNRTTVYRAYQELLALGYIDSRPGAYTTVRARPKIVSQNTGFSKGMISWPDIANTSSSSLFNTFQTYSPEYTVRDSADIINLSQLDLDSRLFPIEDFRRCINQVLVNDGSRILTYCEYAGYHPLREYLAQRLRIHGISVSSDEILITNGAQQALDLILKLLTVVGTKVAIESPTYANILPLLNYYQLDIVEIPMGADGLSLEYLEDQLEKQQLAFLYTIPNFHNPTGIITPQSHREALLALCEKHHLPIVEDGFEEEMKYFGKVVLPIKSMDKNQIVLYLGTFSKVLFPGIRIGWIAAEKDCIQRLTALKRFSDISSSTLIQAVVAAFCRKGYYDLHIKRMHRTFRRRMQVALNAMRENMPDDVIWTQPTGGYIIWVELKKSKFDEASFKEILLKHGVVVSPGSYYFHRTNPQKYFRISIASLTEGEIEEGIIRLGRALRALAAAKS